MKATILPVWKIWKSDELNVLRQSAQPIPLGGIQEEAFQQMIDDMVATMYAVEGIGLAAPQIGRSVRLAVIAGEVDHRAEPLVLINPVIEQPSVKQTALVEGCLSISKVYGPVSRPASVGLKAIDRQGQPYSLRAHGLLAKVIQHEVDHLNGKLFIDRASDITEGKDLL